MNYAQALGKILAAAIGGAFLLLAPLYVLDAFNATNYGNALLNTLWTNVTSAWALNVSAWFACGITLAVLAGVGTIAAKTQEVVGSVASAASSLVAWLADQVNSKKAEA